MVTTTYHERFYIPVSRDRFQFAPHMSRLNILSLINYMYHTRQMTPEVFLTMGRRAVG